MQSNRNGAGGDTDKGIEIISVAGKSDAEFTLLGDYDLASGTPAVIAGAYTHRSKIYGSANLYREFLGETPSVRVAGEYIKLAMKNEHGGKPGWAEPMPSLMTNIPCLAV